MNDFNERHVDPRVSTAVADINAMVVGASPAMAIGLEYLTLANSQALAAYNAVFAQQQTWITEQSASVAGTIRLLAR
jgi:Killing trait